MSAPTTATVIAGIGVAANVASSAYSLSQGAAKATGAPALGQVGGALNSAASARSLLLETAGGSSGQSLDPSQVGGGKSDKLFGN